MALEEDDREIVHNRIRQVCRDFIMLFFDRISNDSSGAFDTIDLERAKRVALDNENA